MGGSKKLVKLGAIGALAVGAVVAAFILLGGGGSTSEQIFSAWYFETANGPVVVVSHGAFTSARYGDDTRHSVDATSTMTLYAHRVADGTYLGSARGSWIGGGADGKLWVIDKERGPQLFDADTMKVVADRAAVVKAAGGEFELTRHDGFVNPYNGWLVIKMADGKKHWITPSLDHHRDDDAPTIPPSGWYCNIGRNDLIQPYLAVCLPPAAAPVTGLFLSKGSALKRDKDMPEMLSGVSASFQGTRVVWTKSLADLVETPDPPQWMGAHVLDAHSVVVMMRTAGMHLHILTIDPANGSVRDRKVLFESSKPGH